MIKRVILICVSVLIVGGATVSATFGGVSRDEFLRNAKVDEFTPSETAPSKPRSLRSVDGKRARKGGPKQFQTGYGDPAYVSEDPAIRKFAFDKTLTTNGEVVRLLVSWRSIAPESPTASFNATDPADPQYNWNYLDDAVIDADGHGLRSILLVDRAPDWAEGPDRPADVEPGSWKPNPEDLGDFGTAIATRYSGDFQSLPRVSDYLTWNEPNLATQLMPQWNGVKPASPDHYRDMLNAFYDAVHAVSKKNTVSTGGTGPYGSDPGVRGMRPLLFWREVMCIQDKKGLPSGPCPVKAKFDALAHHPINTVGGPTESATDPDDISTPDLENLVDVLRAAERAGNVLPKKKHHEVWATEFWWETNPPDPSTANPTFAKQAIWYEEALYVLWKQGASIALPYQVRDQVYVGTPGRASYETGVYDQKGKPKPSAQALAFPFVAERDSKAQATLWGIAPASGQLVVEGKGKGPKTVSKFKVKAHQVFQKKLRIKGSAKLRAKLGGETSLYYPLDN